MPSSHVSSAIDVDELDRPLLILVALGIAIGIGLVMYLNEEKEKDGYFKR
jgi:hypothetical protein